MHIFLQIIIRKSIKFALKNPYFIKKRLPSPLKISTILIIYSLKQIKNNNILVKKNTQIKYLMTQIQNRNKLLTVKNLISYKQIKQMSKCTKKTKSLNNDKSPVTNDKSLFKIFQSQQSDQIGSSILKARFQIQIEAMSDEQIYYKFRSDLIFKTKFQIWMNKIKNSKFNSSAMAQYTSDQLDEVLEELGDNKQTTYKKAMSLYSIESNKLYERLQNLIIDKILPLGKAHSS